MNSAGEWLEPTVTISPSSSEQLATLTTETKRLREENEGLRVALRGIGNAVTLVLERKAGKPFATMHERSGRDDR